MHNTQSVLATPIQERQPLEAYVHAYVYGQFAEKGGTYEDWIDRIESKNYTRWVHHPWETWDRTRWVSKADFDEFVRIYKENPVAKMVKIVEI